MILDHWKQSVDVHQPVRGSFDCCSLFLPLASIQRSNFMQWQ